MQSKPVCFHFSGLANGVSLFDVALTDCTRALAPETAAPRPPTHSSVPALLHLLQNEWDANVLGTYTLQQQLNATLQELSYALYAQDAASRVIARLIRERDAAREFVFLLRLVFWR